MARKNSNARKSEKWQLPNGIHLMYSPDELYQDATVVRYMGEQDDLGRLTCYHPEGYVFHPHISNLWLPRKKAA